MKKFKKLFACLLMAVFTFQQCLIMPAMAVDITGAGVQDVTSGNSYNIEKQFSSGTTDFRNYNQFNLSKDQIANLIFSSGSNKFVNLMRDNAFNINGIVNSMQGGAFFNNGHVIFVSPQGTVIGASGVLNVGALSIFTPSTPAFDIFTAAYALADGALGDVNQGAIDTALGVFKSGSQGEITINGKVFSRGNVELYGSDIKVGNGTNKAGIFAGVQTSGTQAYPTGITTESQVTALFNALVNNNVAQGAGFGLNNGKIVVNAQSVGLTQIGVNPELTPGIASVDINNAHLGADKIVISAENTVSIPNQLIDETEARVSIKGAILDATSIDITARAKTRYGQGILDGILAPLKNILDTIETIEKLADGDILSAIIPTEGAKATAKIDIENSTLNAKDNVNIFASATAETDFAPTVVAGGMPSISFSTLFFNNSADAQVNVKNTKINAGKDVNIDAVAISDLKVLNMDSSFMTLFDDPAKIMLTISDSKSTAQAIVDSATEINSRNLNISAVNYLSSVIEMAASTGTIGGTAVVGSAALLLLINNIEAITKAEFGGKFNSHNKAGNLNVNAQSLLRVDNNLTASAESEANKLQDTVRTKLLGALGATLPSSITIGDFFPDIAGAVVINSNNALTQAIIGNSANVSANDVTVNANLIDLTTNQAIAKSEVGKEVGQDNTSIAAGMAVIVNNQNNTTVAKIEDGTSSTNRAVVDATNIYINATSELPMNLETLELLFGPLDAGTQLVSEDMTEGLFDKYITGEISDLFDEIVGVKFIAKRGVLGAAGFTNNYAQSSGKGGSASIGGSIVYSDVKNATTAKVGDFANLKVLDKLSINAANKVIYTNFAGDIGSALGILPALGTTATEAGIGGSLILSFNEHNASAGIGNNAVIDGGTTAKVGANAATSQTLINVAAGGGKAGNVAITGSIAVVDVSGKTNSSIGSNTKIDAAEVSLSAGKASINTMEREDVLHGLDFKGIDDTTNRLALSSAADDVADKATLVTITGAMSQKEGGSSGVAIGASVGVVTIDREVISHVGDNSVITIKDNFNMNSQTETTGINVAIAGAFEGGVSADKTKNNTGSGANSDKQKTSNQGGWMDKITSILNLAKGITESGATTDATNNALNNPTDNNAQNALGETGKDNVSGDSSNNKKTIGDNLADSNNLTGDANKNAQASDATSNISIAAAGSVNATISNSKVSATVGNAAITKTGTDARPVSITASQDTLLVDVAGGVAKASTAGAGAALNLNMNNNETVAGSIGTLKLNGSDLKIEARENQMAVDAAVGVGVTSSGGGGGGGDGTSVAIGGSFNATVIDNKVKSYLGGKVENAKNVTVDAINKVQLIKVAGGAAVNTGGGGSSTAVGAGLAGNLNVLSKETVAQILNDAEVNVSGNVIVAANRKIDENGNPLVKPNGALDFTNAFNYADDMIISAAAAATVVTGGSSSFTLTGALGIDIMNNVTQALIGSGASITSSTLRVEANDYVFNNNIAGAINFSGAQSSYGVGVGAIVEVANNLTEAKIDGASKIQTTGNLDVIANYDEILNFLAINGSVATGGGFIASVNGIVNVLLSTVNAEISNSQNIKSGNLNVLANYDSTIEGVTAAVTLNVGEGFCASANIIVNVINNEVSAKITDSNIVSTGKVEVSAISEEEIYLIPVAVAIATGSSAVAANIAATVLLNETTAKISGATTINASGDIDVIAKDDTTQINRGGTVAVGAGTAAVGGSIIVDVYSKTVEAVVDDNVKITKAGNVKVEAEAKNYFGPKNTVEIGGISGLGENTGANEIASLADWEMVFDAAGGNSAAVSGSLITKVINNNVTAKVGKGAEITSGSLSVSALNDTVVRAIVGNITASGTAAVGASLFVNVVTGTTQALIDDGAKITSTGNVNINATTIEDVRTIMAIGGGAGTIAVNGSANVNVFVNNTNATVGDNVVLNANSLNIEAKETVDIQSINLVANGAGSVAIGAIAYVNTIANKVKAGIGESEITITNKTTVKAESDEAFGGIFLIGNGSGVATIGGLAIVNVINSDVKAYLDGTTVTAGSLDVISIHNYNEWKYKSDAPIITGLNIGASGAAAIAGTVITNVIAANSSATVDDSTISTTSGLKIEATSDEKLFDIIASIAVSGSASIIGTAIVNVTDGEITAALKNSTVNRGAVTISAEEKIDILETIGSVAISGGASIGANAIANILQSKTKAYSENTVYNIGTSGITVGSKVDQNIIAAAAVISGGIAGISGTAVVNTVNNEVSAYMNGGTITKAGNINVNAIQDTFISGDSAGLNAGAAAIGVSGVVNVLSTQTLAYINGTEITDAGDIKVSATSSEELFNVNVNGNIGVGFAGGINAIVNVIENETAAYINAGTKNVKANSITISASDTIDITDIVGTIGLDASFGGVAVSVAAGVNVINNYVRAELLSTTGIYTVTNNVSVSATSDITLTPIVASVAIGGFGLAGSASVISIGGKYTNNGENYNSDGSVDKTQEQANREAHSKTVNGKTYSTATVDLKTGANKDGTVARIAAAEVKAANITVEANNTVDLTSGTAAISGGLYGGLSANVLVTDMKYKTTAKIENTKISATGDVKVKANSDVEALTASAAASIGGIIGISATVAYFANNAVTEAIMSNITEGSTARNVSILANSTDDIESKVLSVGAGLVASSIVVGIAETNNKTRAIADNVKIINTGNTDIIASTTSSLSTDVASATGGGASVTVVVNRAKSNALTEAIIKGASNINSGGNLRLISATGGISSAITMYMGSVSMFGIGVDVSTADVSSIFNTKIEDTSIVEANNVDLKAGVSNTDYTSRGQLSAEVKAYKASAGLVSGAVSYQKAIVNGNTNIETASGTKLKARNILTVLSALSRTARTGQNSVDIGGITVGVLTFNSEVKGDSNIDLKGAAEANSMNITMNDTRLADTKLNLISASAVDVDVTTIKSTVGGNSNIKTSNLVATNGITINSTGNSTSNIDTLSASLSLVGGSGLDIASNVSTNSNITTGNAKAGAINITNTATKNANIRRTSGSASLVGVGVTNIKSSVSGTTSITAANNTNMSANSIALNVNDTSTADVQVNALSISAIGVNALNIDSEVSANSKITMGATNSSDKRGTVFAKITERRNARLSNASNSASIAGFSTTNMKSILSGASTIDKIGTGTVYGTDVTYTIDDITSASSSMASLNISLISGSTLNMTTSISSAANLTAQNVDATGTLKTLSGITRTAVLGSESTSIGIFSINSLNLYSNITGSSTLTMQNCIANAIDADLNDNSTASVSMMSAAITLVSGSINNLASYINNNTTVNLNGTIKANTVAIDTDVQRGATTTAQQKSGSLASISTLNVDSTTMGASSVNVTANMTDANYNNALTVNSIATNTAESFTGKIEAAILAISSGRIRNTMNTTNTVALTGANIDSKGNVNLKAENKNNMEISRESASYGGIVVSSDKIINDIDSKSYININNSKINANNFTAEAKTKLSSINPLSMSGEGYGFSVSSKTNLNTTLKQSNEIKIDGGSKINTKNNVNLNMAADTDFDQKVTTEAGGFTALGSGAKSFLTVVNNNTLKVEGSGTEVNAGNNLNVGLNSSNDLESIARTQAGHFAGQPSVESYISLTINNNIYVGDDSKSNSIMSAGNLVKIDFLKNSINTLNQDAYVYAEASIASADWGGGIGYTTNNKLDVKEGAKIRSMKDVIINYSNGNNTLTSKVAYKKVSRILFGIPITSSGSSSRISTSYINNLTLNGTIEAGTGNERVLVIDKDGNIVTEKIKGFNSTDYQVIDSNIEGVDLGEGTIADIDKEIQYLQGRILDLQQDDTNNTAEIAKYQAEINALNALISSLAVGNTIDQAGVETSFADAMWAAANNQLNNSWCPTDSVRGNLNTLIMDAATTMDSTAFWNYLNGNSLTWTTGSGSNTVIHYLKDNPSAVTAIWNQYNSEINAISATGSTGMYKGQVYTERAEADALIVQATSSRNNIQNVVNSMSSDSTAEITKLQGEIDALNAYKLSLGNAQLTGDEAGTGGTILFKDINAYPSKIEITGLGSLNGNGEFLIHGTGLLIDNYSQKSLVFGNINFANVGNAGLSINGASYNSYANTGIGITFNGVTTGVKYTKTADTGITINNWYDHNNPLLTTSHLAKITIMGNILNGSSLVDIFNDSSDITLNGTLSAKEKRIVAAQGDVVMKKIGTLALAANDYIIAGRNVLITGNVTNAGLIQAGIPDRNLVIDDAMYTSKLEVDENGVIKMDKKYKSVYLNETNNIKAIKDGSGNIQLYNTVVDGGTVNISGITTGAGTIKASTVSGYGSIDITNNTNADLIVNKVTNNYITNNNKATGVVITPRNLLNSASTKIVSKNDIIVKGIISSGNNGTGDTGAGKLDLISQEGSVTINDNTAETIDATGTIDINAKNGINVLGKIKNRKGNITLSNSGAGDILVEGSITDNNGNILLTNEGTGGVTVKGTITNIIGDTTITNTGDDGILIETSGKIANSNGSILLTNEGIGGVTVKGEITNQKGETTLTNNGSDGILIESSGRVTNNNGNVTLSNEGVGNMTIKGLVLAIIGNIKLFAKDSNIIIGDKTGNDNYIETRAGNSVVNIEINNGSLLNANRNETNDIVNGNPLNPTASALDKTLIKTAGDLKIAVVDGDIGSYDQNKGSGARDNLSAGFSVHGSTRDYTETINANVAGSITASAKNGTRQDKRLINLRSKQSDMNVDKIEADGNVMLTAADWLQADNVNANTDVPFPSEAYFHGYSILNANKNSEGIIGDNISLIASDNLGSETSKLIYRNTNNGWLSVEAENDIFLKGAAGFDSNIWQLISKRGNIEFILNGDAVINKIAAGKHIYLQSLGANLTILSLGIADGEYSLDDDLLFPHDRIRLGENGGGIPETAAIEVLDAYGGNSAYSTLNIFSAYLKGAKDNKPRKGQDATKSDVTLMADKIIATAASAPGSNVHTGKYLAGYENSGRYYAIDPATFAIDFNPAMANPDKVAAEGFTTYGKGPQLSFSIGGVNPDTVAAADSAKPTTRTNFKEFVPIQTIQFFNNILQMPFGKDYKADEVRLSVNSNDRTNENRGTLLNRVYADNAYIDTMDLNLTLNDAQITNYAEFRNGNRGGTGGYAGPYRWLAVIDNDFRRYIDTVNGKKVTVQYYTEKTGSLSINMGNLIDIISPAPAVHYNPYEVSNLPQSENSFFRLTYKDDKIQETTTTPEFDDVDKSTYKPTKREGIRFSINGAADGIVLVSNTEGDNVVTGNDEEIKKKAANIIRILEILDISRGGLKVSYTGELKVGDTFKMALSVGDINADVNVKVMRLDSGSKAGLKFIDLDRATANKILYMNMFMDKEAAKDTPTPQAKKPEVSEKLLGLTDR